MLYSDRGFHLSGKSGTYLRGWYSEYRQHRSLPEGNQETNIILRSGTTEIYKYMFSYNSYLETITLPDSLTTIGANAFTYCPKLKQVGSGSGLTTILESAFEESSEQTFYNMKQSVFTYKGQTYTYEQMDALLAAVNGE